MRGWVLALITAAQFREHYPLLTGTGEDTLLDKLIARADQLMAAFCSHPTNDSKVHTLESSTYTIYPRPRHDEPAVLDLPHPLVSSITSAYIDPDWRSDLSTAYGSGDAVASGDRLLDAVARELWISSTASPFPAWSSVPRANKIVMVAGFAAATATPEFIAMAAMAARHLLDLTKTLGITAITQGGGQSATLGDAAQLLPAAVKEHLGPWVVWAGRVG